MTTVATYNLITGRISGTYISSTVTTESLSSQNTILNPQGMSNIVIPDGKNGGTGLIVDGVYQDYIQQATIPNIMVQVAAALVNSGVVTATTFHPVTLAEMNQALTAVGMTAVSIPAAAPPVS